MRKYELILVLKSSLKDADRKKVIDTVKAWLPKVKFEKDSEMGQKPLSYPIKKEISGFFLDLNFETEEAYPSDFEKRLMANENVLRYLLIRNK